MKKIVTKDKALQRLEGLCSRSEQCEADLNRKMLNWGLNVSDRKEVMDSLKEHRFVDDARFAKSFTNDKARFSYWGPNKIKIELLKRRIKSPIITEVIKNVDPLIWKQGLLKCAVSKAKNLDLTGEEAWDNRQKLFRYLITRGYPSSAASKAVNVMQKRQEEDLND